MQFRFIHDIDDADAVYLVAKENGHYREGEYGGYFDDIHEAKRYASHLVQSQGGIWRILQIVATVKPKVEVEEYTIETE